MTVVGAAVSAVTAVPYRLHFWWRAIVFGENFLPCCEHYEDYDSWLEAHPDAEGSLGRTYELQAVLYWAAFLVIARLFFEKYVETAPAWDQHLFWASSSPSLIWGWIGLSLHPSVGG